jgi:hypothetical protein
VGRDHGIFLNFVGFDFPFSSGLANSLSRQAARTLPEEKSILTAIDVQETRGMVLANRSPFVAQTRDRLAHPR